MSKLIGFSLVVLVVYGILSTAGLVSSAPIDALINITTRILVGG